MLSLQHTLATMNNVRMHIMTTINTFIFESNCTFSSQVEGSWYLHFENQAVDGKLVGMRQPTRQSWINNVDDLTLWLNLLQSFFSYRKRMNTTYLSHKRLLIKSNYFMEVIVAFYLASMHVNMQGTQKNSYKPHRATFTSTPFEWFDEDFVYVSLKGRSTRYRFEST